MSVLYWLVCLFVETAVSVAISEQEITQDWEWLESNVLSTLGEMMHLVFQLTFLTYILFPCNKDISIYKFNCLTDYGMQNS